ncbi:TetR/AcrR family transcriptional regulator [Cohnella lubricantis]|uniref:TetR/AcrR family transcriptional regulator n=1 Tax=Cohnella lubricantis TaxID=2163172 RepID=A0A841TIT8_9BACL|nr:TetR/AcrR family transcriptional regulator [Cohnella lubricantis]MBB6679130.1 TetR/AcrR family transcriptional regulator [Cohnella lubricantis]MBP2120177.1 AcrR family transcriptional regulator [Cohnella lubricantis]
MSPRTKEQNEAIRLTRIRQIQSAAAEVYLQRGMSFEMRDVAAQAGLGYGTVYHYYKNKYELFHELLASALDSASELSARTLADGGPLPERLRAWTVGLLTLWAEEPMVFILYKMASENFHQLPPELVGRLPARFEAELYRPVIEALQASEDEASALENANVLIGSLTGCAGLWLYHGRRELDAAKIADRLLAGFGERKM